MASKSYISDKPNFICSTNGEIIINKLEKLKKGRIKQVEEGQNKHSEPYLFRKWHSSKQDNYVFVEFRNVKFTV